MESLISLDLSLMPQEARYSVDDAVRAIGEIHRQLEAIEDYRLKLKWWMGHVLKHTSFPKGKRTAMVDHIALRLDQDFSIRAKKSVLYEAARVYEMFSGDYLRFVRWIEEQKRLLGRPVYWYDVVRLVLGGHNNPDVVGRELADELDYREAERAIEAIERIVMRASGGNEEARGVLEAVQQNITGLLILHNHEPRTPRSPDYRRFVASYPCIVCDRSADAHHALGRSGAGLKASDFGCVPLCRVHHVELHHGGQYTFEKQFGVDLLEAAFNQLHRYVTGTWITMTLEPISGSH